MPTTTIHHATALARAAGVAAVLALVPGLTAAADGPPGRDDRLLGRAVLDVNTYAPGPQSGLGKVPPPLTETVINGIKFPTPSQPVEGFSAIVERRRGGYLAMPDNGFGGKANSFDFLIRAYELDFDFKTAEGGSGDVHVGDFIQFSDPNRLIGFPIVREGTPQRWLTGGDIDPESLQVGRRGDLWVGDEFGPWILHFDAEGRLLEKPFAVPGGVTSPSNPLIPAGTSTHPNSRGFEGMGIAGRYLYPILEGPKASDAAVDGRLRRMYEFDTRRGGFTGKELLYRVENAAYFVSDVAPLDRHRLVVMERDNSLGATTTYRRLYVVDLRHVGPDGVLEKRLVLDLANIPDPDLVSLPAIHPGDVRIGNPFAVVCESVEAVRVIDHDEVLVGCDNNFPNTGRNPNFADDNEFIVVQVPDLQH